LCSLFCSYRQKDRGLIRFGLLWTFLSSCDHSHVGVDVGVVLFRHTVKSWQWAMSWVTSRVLAFNCSCQLWVSLSFTYCWLIHYVKLGKHCIRWISYRFVSVVKNMNLFAVFSTSYKIIGNCGKEQSVFLFFFYTNRGLNPHANRSNRFTANVIPILYIPIHHSLSSVFWQWIIMYDMCYTACLWFAVALSICWRHWENVRLLL